MTRQEMRRRLLQLHFPDRLGLKSDEDRRKYTAEWQKRIADSCDEQEDFYIQLPPSPERDRLLENKRKRRELGMEDAGLIATIVEQLGEPQA